MLRYTKVLAFLFLAFVFGELDQACGMITGGAGNKAIRDPGWPKGADKVFNTVHRIAWWEDPPFGGGQWHSECQGDAEKLTKVLVDFAKIESPKRIIVRNGIGKSFWLDPNHEKKDDRSVETDWVFVIWQKDRWQMQKNLPRHMSAVRDNKDSEPIAVMTIYTGGDIEWKDVEVPDSIDVSDERLEAHGFELKDGRVVEGHLFEVGTDTPLKATITLETVEPQTEGGYKHEVMETTTSDDKGHWQFTKITTGWFRLVARCQGYAPRILYYLRVDTEPGWESGRSELARAAVLRGRVIDDAQQPIADATVRVDGGLYDSPDGYSADSNKNGEFEIVNIPVGSGQVWVHKKGYSRPGLGLDVTVPGNPIELQMKQAGSIRVTVSFNKLREGGYIVHIADAAGEKVGTWGGSGNINSEDWIEFKDIPPGKYILYGQPNPGSADQKTDEVTVEIIGGKVLELELQAK